MVSFNPFLIHLLGNLEGGIPDVMAEKYQTTSDSVDSFGFILEGIMKKLDARGIVSIQADILPTLCQEEAERCDAKEGKAEGEEAVLKPCERKVLFPYVEAGFFCQEFAAWHDQSKGETEAVSHGDSVRVEELMAPANAVQNKKDIHELKTPLFVDVSDDFEKIAGKTDPYTRFESDEWVLLPAHDDIQDLKHMKNPGDQGGFSKVFDVKRGNADTPGFQVNGKVSFDSEYAGGLRNFPKILGNSRNEPIYEDGSRDSFMALASSIADTAGTEGDTPVVIYRSNFYYDRGVILKESLGAAINLMRREGAQKAIVEVHPPELGRIEINVDITQSGELRAAFRVAGNDTANLLTGQLDSLRQTLTATGFQVLGLDVFLNHDGDRDARHGWEKNFKRQKVSHDGLLGSLDEGEKMSFLLNMDAGLLQWIA